MNAPARIEPRYLPPISRDLTVLNLIVAADSKNGDAMEFERALHANPIVDDRRLPSFARWLVKTGWMLGEEGSPTEKRRRKALAIYLEEHEGAGIDGDTAKEKLVALAVERAVAEIHEPQAVRWGSGKGSQWEGGNQNPVHVPSRWLGVHPPAGGTAITYSNSLTAAGVDKGARWLEQRVPHHVKTILDEFAVEAQPDDALARTAASPRPIETFADDGPSFVEEAERRRRILILIAEIEEKLPVKTYSL